MKHIRPSQGYIDKDSCINISVKLNSFNTRVDSQTLIKKDEDVKISWTNPWGIQKNWYIGLSLFDPSNNFVNAWSYFIGESNDFSIPRKYLTKEGTYTLKFQLGRIRSLGENIAY